MPNNRIVMPLNSFIALVEYKPIDQELYITFRSGKQYVYRKFSLADYHQVLQAQNKGNYLSVQVIHNKHFTGEFAGILPQAELELAVLPRSKYYRHLSR